jgi:hypothetical protein
MNDLDVPTFLVELAKQIMHTSPQKLSLLKLIQTVSIEYRDFLANTNLDDSDLTRSAFRMDWWVKANEKRIEYCTAMTHSE